MVDRVTSGEVNNMIEKGENIALLDVRKGSWKEKGYSVEPKSADSILQYNKKGGDFDEIAALV